MIKKKTSEKTWRRTCRDGSFVEGVRHSGEHLHYNKSDGSDIPVHWRDEKSGRGVSLRLHGVEKIEQGDTQMAKKGKSSQLASTMEGVKKGTRDDGRDIIKKSDSSEDRVADLEQLIDTLGEVRGGVNQESTVSMKQEIEAAIARQQKEFAKAAEDVHKKEQDLEERIDTLSEGVADKEADAKDASGLQKSLKTEFVKQHLSKLEQDSKSEASEYKEQQKGLESTVKEVGRQMKDQERRAKKSISFTKI